MKTLSIVCLLFFASLAHGNIPSCTPTDAPNKNYHWNLLQDNLVMQMWCFDSHGLNLFTFVPDLGVMLTPQCQSSLGSFVAAQNWSTQLFASMSICAPAGLTAEQQTQANEIQQQWAPRLFTKTTEYVHQANLGQWLSINGQNQTVPAGTPCNGDSVGGGHKFFDISGVISQQGNVLPEGSYAVCVISYPPSAVTGWL